MDTHKYWPLAGCRDARLLREYLVYAHFDCPASSAVLWMGFDLECPQDQTSRVKADLTYAVGNKQNTNLQIPASVTYHGLQVTERRRNVNLYTAARRKTEACVTALRRDSLKMTGAVSSRFKFIHKTALDNRMWTSAVESFMRVADQSLSLPAAEQPC